MWNTEVLVLIGFTFFAAGLIKGVVGLGLPTVSLAVLTATIGLRDAMALMLIPSLLTNIWQMLAGPSLKVVFNRFWFMAFAAIAGTIAGLNIGIGIDPRILSAVLGGVLCVYAASGLGRVVLPVPQHNSSWWNGTMGLLSGLMTGLAGVFMVPCVLFLQALNLPKDLFVQTMGFLFVVSTVALGVGLARYELLGTHHAMVSAASVAPALAGMWIGQHVRQRLSEDRFRTVLFCALACFGAYLIFRAVIAALS